MKKLFSGDDDSIRALTELTKDGRLTPGSRNGAVKDNGSSSKLAEEFAQEEMAKRAFYAVAIPTVQREPSEVPGADTRKYARRS